MKNSIKNLLITFSILSFICAGSVTPVLGLRFNDVLGSNELQDPGQTLGLKVEVGEGVYSGFDVSNGDFRIFVQQSLVIFGIGTNNEDEPQFTLGGYYNALDNLTVSLDYVVNQLTDDNANPGTPYPDELRIGLSVSF
tara:strand:+ start:114 stop:527 length:414 start_codon:yes stop_codon:yes gene_type:complete